jgi:hypothetical protein
MMGSGSNCQAVHGVMDPRFDRAALCIWPPSMACTCPVQSRGTEQVFAALACFLLNIVPPDALIQNCSLQQRW